MVQVVCGTFGMHEIEMNGVTTIHYAAKRIAGEVGLDDEMYWGLLKGKEVLPNTDLICEHCDEILSLAILQEKKD